MNMERYRVVSWKWWRFCSSSSWMFLSSLHFRTFQGQCGGPKASGSTGVPAFPAQLTYVVVNLAGQPRCHVPITPRYCCWPQKKKPLPPVLIKMERNEATLGEQTNEHMMKVVCYNVEPNGGWIARNRKAQGKKFDLGISVTVCLSVYVCK